VAQGDFSRLKSDGAPETDNEGILLYSVAERTTLDIAIAAASVPNAVPDG
jgi:hypothetical protein